MTRARMSGIAHIVRRNSAPGQDGGLSASPRLSPVDARTTPSLGFGRGLSTTSGGVDGHAAPGCRWSDPTTAEGCASNRRHLVSLSEETTTAGIKPGPLTL